MSPVDFAWRASLVIGLALAACQLLGRRSAALRHAVLATALVAVLVLPLATIMLPAVVVPSPIAVPHTPVRTIPPDVDRATVARDAPATRDAHASSPGRPSAPWLLLLWGSGTSLAIGLLLAALARLSLASRRTLPVEEPRWRAALARVATDLQVSRPVQLRWSPSSGVLAVWGWRRPTLILPPCALDWRDDRIDTVLRHELMHVRRGDWAMCLVATLQRALLWWNPLAWLACRRLALESEQACDDAVLAQGVDPSTYAEHLVAIARALQPAQIALAASMASPSTLHRRISAMLTPGLDRTPPARRTRALIVAATAALLLPLVLLRAEQAAQTLQGVVYDPSGAVLPGVTLVLHKGDTKAGAVSDPAGRFTFPNVGLGRHVLEAKVPGFQVFRQDLDLRREGDWERAVTLPMGRVQESISVKAKRPTTSPAPASGPSPIRVGGNVRPPRKLKDVRPIFPAAMRDAGREGQVKIDAVIGQDGRVIGAQVTSPDVHPDFAVAAVEAVRQWVFSPTLLNGSPVDVVMTVTISFTLE